MGSGTTYGSGYIVKEMTNYVNLNNYIMVHNIIT